jgi:hypothetical protein
LTPLASRTSLIMVQARRRIASCSTGRIIVVARASVGFAVGTRLRATGHPVRISKRSPPVILAVAVDDPDHGEHDDPDQQGLLDCFEVTEKQLEQVAEQVAR